MNKVIKPTDYPFIDETDQIIFLAGPIQGAADWQAEATKIIHSLDTSLIVANPRREYLDGTFNYVEQVRWETHFLNLAGRQGAVLFWMAHEDKHDCRRAFAQTTRFELGQWFERAKMNLARLAFGIEPTVVVNGRKYREISGATYWRTKFADDLPTIKIHDNLTDLCYQVVDLVE